MDLVINQGKVWLDFPYSIIRPLFKIQDGLGNRVLYTLRKKYFSLVGKNTVIQEKLTLKNNNFYVFISG